MGRSFLLWKNAMIIMFLSIILEVVLGENSLKLLQRFVIVH